MEHPLVPGPDAPPLQAAIGVCFVIFLIGAALQVRRLRPRGTLHGRRDESDAVVVSRLQSPAAPPRALDRKRIPFRIFAVADRHARHGTEGSVQDHAARHEQRVAVPARSSVRKTILGESTPIRPCPPPCRAKTQGPVSKVTHISAEKSLRPSGRLGAVPTCRGRSGRAHSCQRRRE